LDWVILVLLLSFMIRGLLRGTVAQVFAFFGLLVGLWAGTFISQWVGEHWHDARPAFVFLLLRWIVAGLGGLAIASAIDWLGRHAGKAVKGGPLGWFDRLVGGAIGLGVGTVLSALVALAAVQAPGLGFARGVAVHGALARPLVVQGARATAWQFAALPGIGWLHAQFLKAEHRLSTARSS
jgi:hypothetical protein